jgi:hypothetical protein
MKELTVTLQIDEHKEAALEEIRRVFQEYTAEDGTHPFEEWSLEETFQSVMHTGSNHMIWERIKNAQVNLHMIDFDELVDGKYLTIAERKAEGQNVQDNHMEAETTERN